ncbi:hypothetical protein KUW17_06025 [Leisingera aquaemixtae]|uniref:hypothetical protein n=1 Tax=Leisingera TaxID=191028 RepID=UPI001C96A95D|nr:MULTISPECIES: hypothetical protein [Leisingera]MBY6066290.1 hypothetical protein [Leisingera aquaemixtae]MCB4456981.1 hypothetical protein [Leisingera sp. McT4-56]
MFKRLLGLSLLFGMAATAPPALAASCGDREVLTQKLESGYSERLTAGGLQKSRPEATVIEVWSSDETGTFTVLVTHANGISCVVATGSSFFHITEKQPDPGTPS